MPIVMATTQRRSIISDLKSNLRSLPFTFLFPSPRKWFSYIEDDQSALYILGKVGELAVDACNPTLNLKCSFDQLSKRETIIEH